MNDKKNNKILITGGAGFIGFHLANLYLKKNYHVIIIDNLTKYYDINLKKKRIKILTEKYRKFIFLKLDIKNYSLIEKVYKKYSFDLVVNLAAQPGIRASIKNPKYVFKNNLEGFFNILDLSNKYKIGHLIYASTSSVYGNSKKRIFKETDLNNTPLQMYSASKVSNEILAYAYSNIYKMNITGLRFFTVYGPYGRPDMAYYKFTEAITKNKFIDLFNNGNHKRDFTFIDDIVHGIYNSSRYMPLYYKDNPDKISHEVINLGKGEQVSIKKIISIIENNTKKHAKIRLQSHQEGDMTDTFSNINKAKKLIHYKPKTRIDTGLKKFINWYKKYNEECK